MRPAMRLVQLAQKFRSQISLRNGTRVADARSILSILLLCATLNSPIDVVVTGADEDQAVMALQELFSPGDCVESALDGYEFTRDDQSGQDG